MSDRSYRPPGVSFALEEDVTTPPPLEARNTTLAGQVFEDIRDGNIKHLPDVDAWFELQIPISFDVAAIEPDAGSVAAWVCSLAGEKFYIMPNQFICELGNGKYAYRTDRVAVVDPLDVSGPAMGFRLEQVAQDLLGISDNAAAELFDTTNTRDRVLYILEQLADGIPEEIINWHLGGYRRRDFKPNAAGPAAETIDLDTDDEQDSLDG